MLIMDVEAQIQQYISEQENKKQQDLLSLHELMLTILPTGKLWIESGKNDEGKIVANPTIGYGNQTQLLAKGKSREIFQVGISANSTGISIYLIGIRNKLNLTQISEQLGKAKVTGYCIKFKQLADVNIAVLTAVIRQGIEAMNV